MADLVLAKNKLTSETAWIGRNILETFPEQWELSPKGKSIEEPKTTPSTAKGAK